MEERSGAFEEDQNITRSITLAGCLLASALAPQAVAQTLYKSTLPDGQVVHGDKAVESARGGVEQARSGK